MENKLSTLMLPTPCTNHYQELVENSGLLPGDRLAPDQVLHLTRDNQTPSPPGISTAPLPAAQIASANTL